MSDADIYPREFYVARQRSVASSADAVVPFLVQRLGIHSVVDYGCGTGTWLKRFKTEGVHDVLGLDGGHIHPDLLEISPTEFCQTDLRSPTAVDRIFDLAICLEVAEHLPESAAPVLVETLVKVSPAVLFGAAIPGQGGSGHINEQWQSYWADLFAVHGYFPDDALRHAFWSHHPLVTYHYSQNTLLYTQSSPRERPSLSVMHPVLAERLVLRIDQLEQLVGSLERPSLRRVLKSLPRAAGDALRARLNERSRRRRSDAR